jgi:hypothetical protein
MTKSLKAAFAALALFVSTAPATVAFASAGDQASCLSSSFTQHGIWDCR